MLGTNAPHELAHKQAFCRLNTHHRTCRIRLYPKQCGHFAIMRVMSEKGLVKRQGSGRGAQWTASITQNRAAKSMVSKLVDHVFDGSTDLLAAHLIEGGQLSPGQLAALRAMIDQKTSADRRASKKKGAK